MGVTRQIIGSFEDIGKDIAHEIAKVPKDIAGKALESLGASSGKKTQSGSTLPGKGDKGIEQVSVGSGSAKSNTPLDQFGETKDAQVKQAIARAALSQLAGRPQQKKEPSVWEKLQQEEAQKKEMAQKQAAAASMSTLPVMTSKRKRGDLYGRKAKQSPTEISKNVRQD